MKLIIKDEENRILGMWVAKTKRGFNKKQKKEIKKIRNTYVTQSYDYER